MYSVTKTYGHELGWSVCFRQWKAVHSHCHLCHGYSLAVDLELEADVLDDRNWVFDFGNLKGFKNILSELLDHTTLVAADDPEMDEFIRLHEKGLMELRVLPGVGCERLSEHIMELAIKWVESQDKTGRVRVKKVTVHEHGANSASCSR